jgi:hypothetical protein
MDESKETNPLVFYIWTLSPAGFVQGTLVTLPYYRRSISRGAAMLLAHEQDAPPAGHSWAPVRPSAASCATSSWAPRAGSSSASRTSHGGFDLGNPEQSRRWIRCGPMRHNGYRLAHLANDPKFLVPSRGYASYRLKPTEPGWVRTASDLFMRKTHRTKRVPA